ncbi:hypothetical protein C8Q76DRAFT_47795 [Earliella scabrosa]|nr:hypothetical protein C8Q76DRAFT_47795 [Earliella scabrosa]
MGLGRVKSSPSSLLFASSSSLGPLCFGGLVFSLPCSSPLVLRYADRVRVCYWRACRRALNILGTCQSTLIRTRPRMHSARTTVRYVILRLNLNIVSSCIPSFGPGAVLELRATWRRHQ